MKARFFILLGMLLLLLGVTQAQAAPLLLPMETGMWFEYAVHDSAIPVPNTWTERAEVTEKVIIDGKEYFHLENWGYDGPGTYMEHFARSEETAVYSYSTSLGAEVMTFQLGSIGHTWSYPQILSGSLSGQVIVEIIDITPVSVPYGDFTGVYIVDKHFVPDDPGVPAKPHWYEAVKPGFWVIGTLDYWVSPSDNPPVLHLLTGRGVVPLPGSLLLLGSGLLGLGVWRRRR